MAKPPARRVQRQTTPQPAVFQTQVKHHSGPLPAPEDLQRYELLSPGAADRIITMAEVEQRHRTSMEQAALVSDQRHRDSVTATADRNARSVFRSDMVGQILGALIALGCVAGAIISVYLKAHPTVSIAFVSLPVIGIIKAVRNFNSTGKPPKR